ncbi:hypothetical protein ACJ73_00053 [Blastomyces percursus]|uniref:Uncharacterized protein n=1 Tax=Blastomyces percursus TaxID=1658174 RepID=A0A1J9QI51_9EURO|nr:hypothetical protein ACJ73_00053 [Blastomyces percursus]
MATSQPLSIRRALVAQRVVAVEILHAGFKDAIRAAGNAANVAIQEQHVTAQTQKLLILPEDPKYIPIEKVLVRYCIPKSLPDPILPNPLRPSTVKPVKPQVFSYRKGSFTFRKYPIVILTPLTGAATLAIMPMKASKELDNPAMPDGDSVALDINPDTLAFDGDSVALDTKPDDTFVPDGDSDGDSITLDTKPDNTFVPDGDPIAINWSPGYYIVIYGPFDIRIDGEGEVTLIVIGYKRKAEPA